MNGVNIILYLYFHQIEIFQMMKNVFALQAEICVSDDLTPIAPQALRPFQTLFDALSGRRSRVFSF